ncbi:SAM-dependent methyltransferase [Actinophytocola gossypii]|uniref:SAM-dependent methyltransferase n=1 Tax=Actinophytocola gossypii TaxID=2812003 RepID=A0ABT2JEN4_9PSEU|nr:SAM-dependent methyltransferase [Actinophytocola gossypii]MCT2586337.1 SAM-dependent methyltransferase [Actinophytocola gossypii]
MASADRPDWAPESIDLDRPNAARVYDYLLGGAANFEQDREFANKLLEVMPEARAAARLNRAFLHRAVRYCVGAGIRQFVDVGSGIPTAGNVHEIAQELAPECRVLYVDSEAVAVTHSELILHDNDRAEAIRADLTDPAAVLESPAAGRLIDFAAPVAVLMVAVLHFIPDSAQPHAAVTRYVEAMAPGSLLVLSHGVELPVADRAAEIDELYRRSANPGVRRTPDEVAAFFTGTELVEPGLVWTPQWRPESPNDVGEHPEASLVYAGVGRKP